MKPARATTTEEILRGDCECTRALSINECSRAGTKAKKNMQKHAHTQNRCASLKSGHRATSKRGPMPTSLHTHAHLSETQMLKIYSTLRSTKLPGRFPSTLEVVAPGASVRAVEDPSLARGLLLPPLPSSSPGASLVTRSRPSAPRRPKDISSLLSAGSVPACACPSESASKPAKSTGSICGETTWQRTPKAIMKGFVRQVSREGRHMY